MILKQQLYSNLVQAEACSGYFVQHKDILEAAQLAYSQEEWKKCSDLLGTLPTADDLYAALLVKLEGKRLIQFIRKIDEGHEFAHYTKFKALSSLLTHIIIEIDLGNTQYELLIPKIMDAMNVLAFPSRILKR
jgi:hypothetical protein